MTHPEIIFDTLSYTPSLSLFLGVILLLFIAWILWQRKIIFLFRAIAILLIGLALLNPSFLMEERTPLPTIVALIEDQSASQQIKDRAQITTLVKQRLKDKLNDLDKVEIRSLQYVQTGNKGTELFTFIKEALNDITPEQLGAIIILSDGQIEDIPQSTTFFGRDIPIHSLISGVENEKDRRITGLITPRFLQVGQKEQARFIIEENDSHMPRESQPIRVTLKRNGEEHSNIFVKANEPFNLDLLADRAGETLFEIKVEPLEGEISLQNNSFILNVKAIREALKVLLISGQPHMGLRVWRDLLKSDTHIDLVHFTILRPPEKQDNTPRNELSLIAFPTHELFAEKINDFDLIILDSYTRRGVLPLLYFDNIVAYVKGGGALLVSSGEELLEPSNIMQTSLKELFPITLTGHLIEKAFTPQISKMGQKHPITAPLYQDLKEDNKKKWGPWYHLIEASALAGNTLLQTTNNEPILITHRKGQGRIGLLLSDQIWLWARGHKGAGPQQMLLRRLSHWLMKEPDLEEERLTAAFNNNTLTIKRRTLKKDVADVSLINPQGKKTTLPMQKKEDGLFSLTIDAPLNGLWRFIQPQSPDPSNQKTLTTLAYKGDQDNLEYKDLTSTTKRLTSLSKLTDGLLQRMKNQDNTVTIPKIKMVSSTTKAHQKNIRNTSWIGIRQTQLSQLETLKIWPLFSGLIGLILLFGIWLLTWWFEGKK